MTFIYLLFQFLIIFKVSVVSLSPSIPHFLFFFSCFYTYLSILIRSHLWHQTHTHAYTHSLRRKPPIHCLQWQPSHPYSSISYRSTHPWPTQHDPNSKGFGDFQLWNRDLLYGFTCLECAWLMGPLLITNLWGNRKVFPKGSIADVNLLSLSPY